MAKTEATTPRKQNRGGSSWISVAVALVATAGFLGWLATRQPPETVAVDEPGGGAPADAADTGPPATVVQPDALTGTGPREYLGQDVELTSVPVTSPLGSQLFWIELPGGTPYLVLLAQGTQPPAGTNVRVVGRVTEKTDALLDEWEQAGVLQSADHRLQAEYGSTFIEARRVVPAAN
jgi:hypothetical protein